MFAADRIRTATVATAAVAAILLTGTSTASASTTDTTPPTAPRLTYAEGFQCLTVILGAMYSTDNVTPQLELRYQAFDDGVPIGSMVDRGGSIGPWGVLQLTGPGQHTVTVQAIDAAGNRSALSNAEVVTGYYTPGCTPLTFG